MSFWTDKKLLLKRPYRYEGFFEMSNTSTPVVTAYNTTTGNFVVTEPVQAKIAPFQIQSFDKPKMKTNINNLGGQNPLNGIIKYKLESMAWADCTIKVYDTFRQGEPTKDNPANSIMSWLDGLGYDAGAMATAVQSGKNTFFVAKLNSSTAALTINVIDDNADTVEKWKFLEPKVNSIDFGIADYQSDAAPIISLTFSIAAVEYEAGG